MAKVLLFGDLHLKPFKDNNPHLSRWEYQSQKYSIDRILEVIKTEKPSKVYCLGDIIDTAFPQDYELELLDYFLGSIPKGVQLTLINGNHELNRDTSSRSYYFNFMKEYYESKYNIKVLDYEEQGDDLFVGHKHISKLENIEKDYRYIFSHIRSSDSNGFFTDEINMSQLKASCNKVFLGDIHKNLEYDNVFYTGESSWVNFPSEATTESFNQVVPSVLILDEKSGKHERIALFEEDSPYQKKYIELRESEFDQIEQIVEQIKNDCEGNNHFYKVRLYGTKFMIDKVKVMFSGMKSCCVLDIVNTALKGEIVRDKAVDDIMSGHLDRGSVSKNCLDFCKKNLGESRLEPLLCSIYATLEGNLEKGE